MEDIFTILGISISEFFAIVALLILFFNPDEIIEIGRIIARGISRIIHSPFWDFIKNTAQDLNSIPAKLVRDETVETIKSDLAHLADSDDLPPVRLTFQELQRSDGNPNNPPVAEDGENR